ncbi:hypothetical protein CUMW_066920, partial [Citrus unshiu]
PPVRAGLGRAWAGPGGFAVVGLFKYPTAHIGYRVYGTVCLGDPLRGDTVQPTLDTLFSLGHRRIRGSHSEYLRSRG